jgi:hypothetical protein
VRSYTAVPSHNIYGFNGDEWKNGVFDIDNGELYFINTGKGKVEIHRTSRASKYSNFDLHSGTAIRACGCR